MAKAVSHSLNNCVNCLPGQKDVDMALKSIGEASKKLLIETVSHRSSAGTTSASQIAFCSHGGRKKETTSRNMWLMTRTSEEQDWPFKYHFKHSLGTTFKSFSSVVHLTGVETWFHLSMQVRKGSWFTFLLLFRHLSSFKFKTKHVLVYRQFSVYRVSTKVTSLLLIHLL